MDNSGTSGAPNVVLTYTYDGRGNVATVTDNLGGTTTYTWDAVDRITGAKLEVSGKNAKPNVTFTYDQAGRMATILRSNGPVSSSGGSSAAGQLKTVLSYDNDSRLTGLAHQSGGMGGSFTTVRNYNYNWDAASQLTSEVNSLDGTVSYTYDNASQLRTCPESN